MHVLPVISLSRPKLPVPPNAAVVPYYEYVSGFLIFSRSVSRDSVVPGCPTLADITISCNFLLFRRPLLPLPFILRPCCLTEYTTSAYTCISLSFAEPFAFSWYAKGRLSQARITTAKKRTLGQLAGDMQYRGTSSRYSSQSPGECCSPLTFVSVLGC